MLVYILNNQGKSLMPCKPQKARKLLKQNEFVDRLSHDSCFWRKEKK